MLKKYNLTEDEQQILWYLIHDKSHVMKLNHTDHFMDSILTKCSSTSANTLYRGVSNLDELHKLISGKPVNNYTSYSEDPEVAKAFGTVVTLLSPSIGFSYKDWLVSTCKKIGEDDAANYASMDGDFIIETALKEAEWIMPFDMKLQCVDKLIFIQK